MKSEYLKLKENPFQAYGKKILPVNRGELASEYGDSIIDFSTEKSELSNRFIDPYITSNTHGKDVFNGLLNLIDDLKPKNILDLGCGAGEFLNICSNNFPDKKLFGCTIHLGEVFYARNKFNLMDVMPIDMREIENYFDDNSFDCIIAHCCLQFINEKDRLKLIESVEKVLAPEGYFIVVDYKFNRSTGLPEFKNNNLKEVHFNKIYPTMGNLTVYQKCATKIV